MCNAQCENIPHIFKGVFKDSDLGQGQGQGQAGEYIRSPQWYRYEGVCESVNTVTYR